MSEQRPIRAIQARFPNGETWEVPAEIVARHRAALLAKEDSEAVDGEYDAVYADELAYGLSDAAELTDWARSNMSWFDVEPYATRVRDVQPFNRADDWDDCELEAVRA